MILLYDEDMNLVHSYSDNAFNRLPEEGDIIEFKIYDEQYSAEVLEVIYVTSALEIRVLVKDITRNEVLQ